MLTIVDHAELGTNIYSNLVKAYRPSALKEVGFQNFIDSEIKILTRDIERM